MPLRCDFRSWFLLLTAVLLPAGAMAAAGPDTGQPPVVAYYFHGNLRCQTCLTIESLAGYAINLELQEELESGRLAWRPVNYDQPENEHFWYEFGLEGPTLVVVHFADGKIRQWEKLEKVWDLYAEVPEFDRYVLGAVESYLDTATGGPERSSTER